MDRIERNERPSRRVNPGGDVVWVARWTDKFGKRRIGWLPAIKGTYKLKREAQAAITACYEREEWKATRVTLETVGDYFDGHGDFRQSWLYLHPRSDRTDISYDQRVRYVLDVELDGRKLRDWPLNDVTRKQINDLIDHMLRVQGRAADGARGVLRVLNVMWEDAITDQCSRVNPVVGSKIRANDPRVRKPPRRKRIWTWEQMHALAAAAAVPRKRDPMRLPPELREAMERRWAIEAQWRAVYAEPMLRTLADVGGLRMGELLPLERSDVKLKACDEQGCSFPGPHLHIRRTAYRGSVSTGTKTDHGEADAGRQAPIPPAVAAMLAGLPPRIDTPLLFPTPKGWLFRDRNFYRDVWDYGREGSGLPATPHEFRHSYVSLMRAAGVDPADLAQWTGHTVLTATTVYTHATNASATLARRVVGG